MSKDFSIKFDASDFLNKINLADKKVQKGAKRGMDDCVDELVRITSEITPIDKGILQRAYAKEVNVNTSGMEGVIEFSIKEANASDVHFDYALWIHEGDYKLGEKSMMRQGTSAWSGKSYTVGKKYLERPLKGEDQAFWKHIANEIKKELGD